MRFAGLKSIFEICLQLQLEACWCDVIMTLKYQVEVEDGNKKYFWDRKMNLRKDITKYAYLIVFIRHGSAEIWGFQYGVTLGLGTLEIMTRTGFFGLVVCALNWATKGDPSEPSMILAYRRDV